MYSNVNKANPDIHISYLMFVLEQALHGCCSQAAQ